MEKLDLVKLALMCAASGRHNIMLVGPAGCGKTTALQKFGSLIPDLTEEEAQSVNRIKSIAGLMGGWDYAKDNWLRPPFRNPHCSASCGSGFCTAMERQRLSSPPSSGACPCESPSSTRFLQEKASRSRPPNPTRSDSFQ